MKKEKQHTCHVSVDRRHACYDSAFLRLSFFSFPTNLLIMMDEFIVEDLTSESPSDDNRIELLPFPVKTHRISDLTAGDVEVIQHGIHEFMRLVEDLYDDLPTGLIGGLEQLQERLEVQHADISVN